MQKGESGTADYGDIFQTRTGTVPMFPEKLKVVVEWMRSGIGAVPACKAAEIVGCQSASLINGANEHGTLGSLSYFWAGTKLMVSTASLLRFLTGGYPLREIFKEAE